MLEFYDIKNNIPKIVYRLQFNGDITDFAEYYNSELCYLENFNDYFDLDTYYYIIKDEKPFGVISLHKGYNFIDYAGYDDRAIIKRAFPHMKCDIIGEEE